MSIHPTIQAGTQQLVERKKTTKKNNTWRDWCWVRQPRKHINKLTGDRSVTRARSYLRMSIYTIEFQNKTYTWPKNPILLLLLVLFVVSKRFVQIHPFFCSVQRFWNGKIFELKFVWKTLKNSLIFILGFFYNLMWNPFTLSRLYSSSRREEGLSGGTFLTLAQTSLRPCWLKAY